MKFTYKLTRNAPLFVAGRNVMNLPVGEDGFRTIDLEPADAAPLIASGVLQVTPVAPAPVSANDLKGQDYDFGGQVVRNGRARTNRYTANRTVDVSDKACFVEMNSATQLTVTLPNDWRENEGFELVREGAGDVIWTAASGATIRMPASASLHTKIAERYGSARFRVIKNDTGTSAVWEVKGATS